MANGLIWSNRRYSDKDDDIVEIETYTVIDTEWCSFACGDSQAM